MTPERWRQVSKVFHAALARDVAARASYLDQACARDRALREEVDALLAAHSGALQLGDSVSISSHLPRLASGVMVGSYRIDRLIGVGAMGAVYLAHDTRLGRNVAIKVLLETITAEPERLARLEREARLLAALNHPHIGAIYGLEDVDGIPALVLELVGGPTLADRLEKGPIPASEAVTA